MFKLIDKDTRVDSFFLTILCAFFFIAGIQSGSLASWDEAIYAQIAKEMARSGDWFHLTWLGSSWVEKPLLTFWATAGFYKLFGVSEFSARLFSALCGIGCVLVTYLFGKQLFTRWVGFLSAAVLMSTMHYIRIAKFGTMDAALSFFITLTLYLFWRGRTQPLFLILSGVAAGLVFMTKSFAVLFVFAVIWGYCFLAKEKKILIHPFYGLGLLAAVIVALPWLYCGFAHLQPQFGQEMVKNLLGRSLSPVDDHAGNYYFYIRTMINKCRPWILIGIFSAPYFVFKAIREKNKEMAFVATWIFSVLAIVTLMRTKLHWYVAPIYPALSISIGWVLAKLIRERFQNLVRIGFVVLMLLHIPASHIFDLDHSREIKGIAAQVAQWVPKEKEIYSYGFIEGPATIFYWERSSKTVPGLDRLQEVAKANEDFFCLVKTKDLEAVRQGFQAEQLETRGRFEEVHLIQIQKQGSQKNHRQN